MTDDIRVLWVDDEASEPKMDTRFEELLPFGIHVEPCDDVHSFIAKVRSGTFDFDVVVMDLIMPPQGAYPPDETARGLETGLRLLKELRATAPKVPIVVVTIRSRSGLDEALRAVGVSEYLPKSADLTMIAAAIRRASMRTGAGGAYEA